MIKIDILTIFPDQVHDYAKYGIFRIAQEKDVIDLEVHDLRKWGEGKHKNIDDRPYGGGAGMVMSIKPIDKALQELKSNETIVIAATPVGQKLNQNFIRSHINSFKDKHLIFLCGHYEGFDERVLAHLVDIQISIGDYVLSSGELSTLVILDSFIRLLPGVLGKVESHEEDSFENGLLEYPHYTRPEEYNGWKVPEVLLSGDHGAIDQWRANQSKLRTEKRRPDLLTDTE